MSIQSTIKNKQPIRESLCKVNVLKTLLYADIFNYPMTSHEIFINLIEKKSTHEEVQEVLDELVSKEIVFQHGFLYSMNADPASCKLRKEKNELAKKYMRWAQRISNFIGGFPFVEGVFLSGSISKDCMDKDGDIDYFIVTRPGRLWLSRTLLIAFKKVFLLNSYKFFCLNYFVDSKHMKIEKRNIYTATEIVTLIPTYNNEVYKAFIENNEWAMDYRPNFPLRTVKRGNPKNTLIKKSTEYLLGGKLGDAMEKYCHKTTEKHWKKKFRNYHSDDYELAIQTSKHTSQINPENFHKRVLAAYHQKIAEVENAHGISITNN